MEDKDHTSGRADAEWSGEKLAEELNVAPRPVLKGSLAPKPVEGLDITPKEEKGAEVGIGSVIIQRDSGDRWEIVKIIDNPRGGKLVNLNNLEKKVRATLDLDDLNTKLSTEGSAWHW